MTKIEEYVNCLLESWAVYNSGEELVVWQTLHDLLMAVSRYELMSDMHKEMTTQLCKKLQHHFKTKFVLRERKETRKKKNFPPYPLLKEKIKKETEEKNPSPRECEAREIFRRECLQLIEKYGKELVTSFYNHFSQKSPKTGHWMFEDEEYWDTEKRLARWASNKYASDDTAAAIRLSKLKQKQSKEVVDTEQQRQLAAEREQADAQREAEREKSRESQMTTAEYIQANPDSLMARIYREKNKGVGPQGASKSNKI